MIGVEMQMPPGLHVYAPKVGNEYRGISWQMADSQCWTAGDTAYPEPLWKKMQFAEDKLPVYQDTLRLSRELVIQPVLSASDPSVFKAFREICLDSAAHVKASGVLNFQACDDRQC